MSTVRTIQVLVKLLPSILALRKDRKKWIDQEKNQIDSEQFRKNAHKVLDNFISLGPVYIKLGQWLSSRADILPQPYLEELSKLQDSVPPAPFDQVKPIIEKELGPIDEKFDEIDPNSISGASLGQVYRGSLSGQQIVVKVKRPGIEKVVAKDLKVLKKVLPLALRFVDPNLRYSAKAMLSQFIETIYEEMDYTNELHNLKTIKNDMADSNKVVVPSVYDDLSSKNVLTMEYLPGIKVTNVQALDEKGIDREQLVIDVHKVFFTMLLKHSVFHADPHPGNISVTDDGKLILYDYGMVGKINNETRFKLIRLYLALVERNPPRVVNAMNELSMLTPGYKFPFVLPKNLALYMRMASIIEGIYKTHDVDFKFVKVLRTILEEENLIPQAYVQELKISFDNFSKSIDSALRIGPEMKKLMDEIQIYMKKGRPTVLISGSIFASATFIGSVFLYQSSELLGLIGMISSGLIMAASGFFRKY